MAISIDPVRNVPNYGDHPFAYNESIQTIGHVLIGKIQRIMDASHAVLDTVPVEFNMLDHSHAAQVMNANKSLTDYHMTLYRALRSVSMVRIPEKVQNGDTLAGDLASLSMNGIKATPFLSPPNSSRNTDESRGRSSDESKDPSSDESSPGSKRLKVVKNGSIHSSVCDVTATSLSSSEWNEMYTRMQPKMRAASVYCTISFVESLESFYIICDTEMSNELHSLLQTSIIKMKKSGIKLLDTDQVEQGTLCAAVYSEDGSYYRALIEHVKDESVEVYFIDYGNREEVKIKDLMPLDDSLRDAYSSQCIKCILENYVTLSDEGVALTKFKTITSSTNNYIKATFLESIKRPAVYFWRNDFTGSISINPRLVSLFYASKSDTKNWINIITQLH